MRLRAEKDPVDRPRIGRIGERLDRSIDCPFWAVEDEARERRPDAGDYVVPIGVAQAPGDHATNAAETDHRYGRTLLSGNRVT
jgi:hypothetical protein